MLLTFKFRKCYKLYMDNFDKSLPNKHPAPQDTQPLDISEVARREAGDLIHRLATRAHSADFSDSYEIDKITHRLYEILGLNVPTTPLEPITSLIDDPEGGSNDYDDDFLDADVVNDKYPDDFEEYDRSLKRRRDIERTFDIDAIEFTRDNVKTVIQDLQKIAARIDYIDQDFKNCNYVDRETEACIRKIHDVLDSLHALGIDEDSDILSLLNDVLKNLNGDPRDVNYINLKAKIDEIVSLIMEEYKGYLLVNTMNDNKHLIEELEKNLQEIVSGNFRNEINEDPHAYLVGDTTKQKIEDLLYNLDNFTKYPDSETASRSKIIIKFILDYVNGRTILSTQDVVKYITELKSYIV